MTITEKHFKEIVDKLVVLKDTSELMIDLAYSSLFLNSRSLAEEVEALIMKLAKEGHPPSKIGIILRDQHGIPLATPITGKSITQTLKERKMVSTLPEDLENLLRQATRLHVHYDKNKADLHNKTALQITEAKIYKLSKYYKKRGVLPADWKYSPKAISLF